MKITTQRERAPLRSVTLELTRDEAVALLAALAMVGASEVEKGLTHLKEYVGVAPAPDAKHWDLVGDMYYALVTEMEGE